MHFLKSTQSYARLVFHEIIAKVTPCMLFPVVCSHCYIQNFLSFSNVLNVKVLTCSLKLRLSNVVHAYSHPAIKYPCLLWIVPLGINNQLGVHDIKQRNFNKEPSSKFSYTIADTPCLHSFNRLLTQGMSQNRI